MSFRRMNSTYDHLCVLLLLCAALMVSCSPSVQTRDCPDKETIATDLARYMRSVGRFDKSKKIIESTEELIMGQAPMMLELIHSPSPSNGLAKLGNFSSTLDLLIELTEQRIRDMLAIQTPTTSQVNVLRLLNIAAEYNALQHHLFLKSAADEMTEYLLGGKDEPRHVEAAGALITKATEKLNARAGFLREAAEVLRKLTKVLQERRRLRR